MACISVEQSEVQRDELLSRSPIDSDIQGNTGISEVKEFPMFEWLGCLFGHKYGYVQDRYQYCANCGKARCLPCNHEWELLEKKNYGSVDQEAKKILFVDYTIYVLRCKKCGDITSRKDKYPSN